MPIDILMPALSPTMEEGKLAKWLKKEGDTVKSGDVIAEIETDKATMEVEAIDEGMLGKILVPEGTEDVTVNTPIAVILAEGEDASADRSPRDAPTASSAERRAAGRRAAVAGRRRHAGDQRRRAVASRCRSRAGRRSGYAGRHRDGRP